MTTVYFIRHAQADNSIRDGRNRPLTEKGLADRKLVTDFLQNKNVDVVLSSPFKRAVDTIADFVQKNGFDIKLIENFREHKRDSSMSHICKDSEEFTAFLERQWGDFSYVPSDSECLAEVQK